MTTPLVLVAASGLAREVLAMVRGDGSFDVVGMLDDDESRRGSTVDGVPVLGPVEAVTSVPEAQLLVCAGRGSARAAIVARLEASGVLPDRFATVVHGGIQVPQGCSIGAGSVVLAGVVMTTAVTLGKHVVVMPNVTLTHDCDLHDFATLAAGVSLGGGVTVEREAYLGMNSSLREGARVGAGAVLGMGAVLLGSVPPGETWVGVPAAPLERPRAGGDPKAGPSVLPSTSDAPGRADRMVAP